MMGLQSKPSQIFVDGKPLGIVENVHFSTEDPVSDFKPGSYQITLEVKNADMGPELKKIIDELNQDYKKAMDIQKRLNEYLMEVGKICPTLLFIGTTTDKHRAFMMGSPKKNGEKRMIDLIASVAIQMEKQQALREIIFSAVYCFMQENPKYRDGMQEVLNKLKELDEHQRTAQPE